MHTMEATSEVDPPASSRESALRGVAALCAAVDDATSAPEVLRRALPVLRSVLGDRVALDLRGTDASARPAVPDGIAVPVLGHGRRFGVLRAAGFDLDRPSAEAFASAAGQILGTALVLHSDPMPRRPCPPAATPAIAHRARAALATIGVAASTLRLRGDRLAPVARDHLLHDIEANVEALRSVIDDVSAGSEGAGHDG